MSQVSENYAWKLSSVQSRLYAYIRSLLPYSDAAQEVLQETNVVLLRKAGEYDETKSFISWAYQTAYYEVLAYRRDRARDRHVFGDEATERIVDEIKLQAQHTDRATEALELCMQRLTKAQHRDLQARYVDGASVKEIARERSEPESTVSSRLYRIRQQLLTCIRGKLEAEEQQ